jgi:hypothetical protein
VVKAREAGAGGGDPFSLRRITRERDRATTIVTARDVRRYLTDLPKLWRDTEPAGRYAAPVSACSRRRRASRPAARASVLSTNRTG